MRKKNCVEKRTGKLVFIVFALRIHDITILVTFDRERALIHFFTGGGGGMHPPPFDIWASHLTGLEED